MKLGAKSGGLEEGSPPVGPGAKPRQGVWGLRPPEAGAFKNTQPEI